MRKQESSLWKKISSELSLWVLLICLLVVLAVLFLIVVFDGCPRWTSQYLGISKKDEALKFLGIGMGGVLLALQALMAYKRAKALEDTASAQAEAAKAQAKAANAQADAAKAQADATKEQAKANQNTEQGQRQERLKNAIEHLGHDKDSVRLGGAYELFHLAEETKEWHQTILDILCAHIRQTTGKSKYREKYKSKPSEEIQSLLTLLFAQDHKVFRGLRVDLQESWLNGANLDGAHLEKAVLARVYLRGAILHKASMQGVVLELADLQGAFLDEASLQEARLGAADLQGASLDEASLLGARLGLADLQGAFLREAHLQGAFLRETYLRGANLGGAHLQGAFLKEVHLQGANLEGVHLQGVTRSHLINTFWRG